MLHLAVLYQEVVYSNNNKSYSDLEEQTEYYVQIASTAFDDASSNENAGISDTTILIAVDTAATIAITSEPHH